MADQTAIEWTDATWNPVTGCTEVSPGCDHCYAKTLAERFRGTPGHYFEQGFDLVLRPGRLDQPLRWKKPRRIFVNSMSDLFHDGVSDGYIAEVFAVMAQAEQHTFQVLTKRHGRMRSLLNSSDFLATLDRALGGDGTPESLSRDVGWPLPNVWLGVSVENQQWADIRIPALRDTPAAVRFLSMEPLLGPVCLDVFHSSSGHEPGTDNPCELWPTDIDWVIVGGESGRGARPMHPDWVRSLRDQCTDAGVPFLFKQWGEWVPEGLNVHRDNDPAAFLAADGTVRELVNGVPASAPRARGEDITVRRVGKKLAGRHLDGRTWDEFPQAVG